jgi:hypothetical protein
MDEKQRQLDQEQAERQLNETEAKLRMVDARAKQRRAGGAIAELIGLKALRDRVMHQLHVWKEADLETFQELRDQVKTGIEALSRGTQAADNRLDRLDDATDRWMSAEVDQVGAASQIFFAWLGGEWVRDKQSAKESADLLRSMWDDVVKKKQAFDNAVPKERDQARANLENSLGRIKNELKEIAATHKTGAPHVPQP